MGATYRTTNPGERFSETSHRVEYFVDRALGHCHECGIRLGVIGDDEQRLVEGEAPRSGPCGVIDIQSLAEGGASIVAEHAPRSDHVDGRITDADISEIDDGAQPAALDQQVRRQQITMRPHRSFVPLGNLDGDLPRGGYVGSIDDPTQ